MRYGLSLPERVNRWWQRLYHCTLRRRHRVKFGTRPRCFRCGRTVTR